MESFSIIIPAYNEEKRIAQTLDSYYSFFSKKKSDFEIIVVANNCSDNTAGVVNSFSKGKKNVRLLDVPRKIGKGGAVKRGFALAAKPVVAFVDADNSTPPQEFLKILSGLSKADIAIGSRALSGSKILNQPEYRKFLGRSFNFLVNFLFGLPLNDTQCGAKVFSKKTVPIMQSVESGFFEFDVELLWRAKKKGFTILEVPIVWTDAAESKIGFMTVPSMFLGLLRIRFLLKSPPSAGLFKE
ncbi:MAG: dolichyl-phosphate beta-glucosyltransferase [Candidatus Micrarchaeota archaeon]